MIKYSHLKVHLLTSFWSFLSVLLNETNPVGPHKDRGTHTVSQSLMCSWGWVTCRPSLLLLFLRDQSVSSSSSQLSVRERSLHSVHVESGSPADPLKKYVQLQRSVLVSFLVVWTAHPLESRRRCFWAWNMSFPALLWIFMHQFVVEMFMCLCLMFASSSSAAVTTYLLLLPLAPPSLLLLLSVLWENN